ncbi:MAG: DUF4157 domain-containing protein [Thiomonas sp.]
MSRMLTPARHDANTAPDRSARESAADRSAIRAFNTIAGLTEPVRTRSRVPDRGGSPLPPTSAQPLPTDLREQFEYGFGHDFSRVRIFATGDAAEAVRTTGSRAVTWGSEIALAPGHWSPGTAAGRALLAHELAHVVQQASEARPRLEHKSLDEEIDEELAKHVTDPKGLDPAHRDYAMNLQSYGFDITHDKDMNLLEEPKDPKAKAAWKRNFQKAETLAERILEKSGSKVKQKESRAQMLAADLANAGFIDQAMALALKIPDAGVRKYVYQAVLGQPSKVSEAQITTIAAFQAANAASLADHELFSRLTTGTAAYAARFGAAKVNAVLKVVVKKYASDADLPRSLAQLMFFHPASRAPFTEWMMADKHGALLRKVSEQPYFAEGAEITIDDAGNTTTPDENTRAWAIGNRQRVTVEDVLALSKAAGIAISPPTSRSIGSLKAWLEANTEKIGQAVAKQNPGDPEAAKALFTQITEAFTSHVDENITPDKSGHLTKLQAGGPKNSQLKVDCDVLATYGVRLLVASGFTPIGYMAVSPTDTTRAAHAMALLKHGKTYQAISNSASTELTATTKADALKEVRDFGLEEAYDANRPLTGYDIYYMDCDVKGTLPKEISSLDSAAKNGSLSK